MKVCYVLLVSFLFCTVLHSQQWIDKTYQTNPPIEIEYGEAVNFNGTTVSLNLDLYTPICNASPTNAKSPLMIVIHGGSFLAGEKDEQTIVALCENFAQRGYVTASIEYRLGFVNDEGLHQCNYPYYQCFFATDEAEWYRAWFRAVQDAKGALRYLINHNADYDIDTQNVFVVGESAGAIIALGVGFLDMPSEKMAMASALDAAPNPNYNTLTCPHNVGETFLNANIPRPDLGTIYGDIEPTNIDYTIKGVGNMYGAMFQDLLAEYNTNKPKPALYSFHRPCDLIVPADSKKIYYGLSWCLANPLFGINACYTISNTPIVHGSRKIKQWNIDNSYNYSILSEFGNIEFPISFFGSGGCSDQIENNCHGYDSFNLREQHMASFFAPLVTTSIICEPILSVGENGVNEIKIFPNPTSGQISIQVNEPLIYSVLDINGRVILKGKIKVNEKINLETLEFGFYILKLEGVQTEKTIKFIKK